MIQRVKTLFKKYSKDNVGALSSIIAWSILTSIVPILVGLLAISGLLLQGDASARQTVTAHLSSALHGVLTPSDLKAMVNVSIKHAGLLGLIGLLGALWGGSRVGSSVSTAFQAIFETGNRNFFKEKIIDIGMILVMTVLMLVIIAGTTAGSLIQKLFKGFPISGPLTFAIGIVISVIAGFLLFASIYLAFPNVKVKPDRQCMAWGFAGLNPIYDPFASLADLFELCPLQSLRSGSVSDPDPHHLDFVLFDDPTGGS